MLCMTLSSLQLDVGWGFLHVSNVFLFTEYSTSNLPYFSKNLKSWWVPVSLSEWQTWKVFFLYWFQIPIYWFSFFCSNDCMQFVSKVPHALPHLTSRFSSAAHSVIWTMICIVQSTSWSSVPLHWLEETFLVRYLFIHYKHIEAETKWLTFSRWHFQMHFLEWKCMNFDKVSLNLIVNWT